MLARLAQAWRTGLSSVSSRNHLMTGEKPMCHWDTIEPERGESRTGRPIRNPGANPALSTWSKTFRMANIYPFRAWRYNPVLRPA